MISPVHWFSTLWINVFDEMEWRKDGDFCLVFQCPVRDTIFKSLCGIHSKLGKWWVRPLVAIINVSGINMLGSQMMGTYSVGYSRKCMIYIEGVFCWEKIIEIWKRENGRFIKLFIYNRFSLKIILWYSSDSQTVTKNAKKCNSREEFLG